MESFFTFLTRRTQDISSLLCVGLDPHPSDLPAPTAQAARDFCLRLVEATLPYAAAYKPNAAFFEMYGPEGWAVLKEVIETIHAASLAKGSRSLVILDAKRGDIASTAQAYAQSAFDTLGADCITLSPYLGKDSVDPFLANHEKGVFLLCKTSNPGAGDLQDLLIANPHPSTTLDNFSKGVGILSGGFAKSKDAYPRSAQDATFLYEYVAHLAQTWNEKNNVGLVVGATQVESLARVREAAPDLWFLAPGVGAQGGDLETALRAGLRRDGSGMLIPVSRALSRAEDPRKAARDLRDEMVHAQYARKTTPVGKSRSTDQPINPPTALADALLDIGCVKFGEFTLKSGIQSPIYVDLRRLVADPKVLGLVAEAFVPILNGLTFDHLAGLPYAALPIATAISLRGGWPMIYPRKEVKAYGTKAEIEGVYEPGQRAVVIDDLISTGGSKFEGVEKLTAAGLHVSDVVVLIDRSSGKAAGGLAAHGVTLHAGFTLPGLLDYWERTGKVETEKIAA
ncbi:MAG TPA: orotidine-5'-phosphate decarboxylase, partial [Anaerolineales bacterium]|nr:orotidine-5'-phosphate decarboxylase [Anaerolineales bacterium]